MDDKQSLRALHLFAGSGGGLLGGLLCGWRTVCAVERDEYCREVLVARQNDGSLEPFPIWDDVRTFDGRPWQGHLDVVAGGFPCTDISPLGRRAGIRGEKSGLWKEMARIVGEVRPTWVFAENSSDLVRLGLDVVLQDLDALGYDAEWRCLSAAELGAPPPTSVTGFGFWGATGKPLPEKKREELFEKIDAQSGCRFIALPPKEFGFWPTPTYSDAKNYGSPSQLKRQYIPLSCRARMSMTASGGNLLFANGRTGRPNPEFVEWLMGQPPRWNSLEPLETRSFLSWLHAHSSILRRASAEVRYTARIKEEGICR